MIVFLTITFIFPKSLYLHEDKRKAKVPDATKIIVNP
ncbi:MAG: hypothetical protein JWN14_3215 [Chthonomonadales bacterium]|nr:hypothetical protein [Chthonomonadales bacterium]